MLKMEYRTMEYTRQNSSTGGDDADGVWHLVIAPRGALQDQQDQQHEKFCTSLPRAHFLRPGSAFSPYRPDRGFEGEEPQSRRTADPNPLAQPGFHSPKILRSNFFKPLSSAEETPAGGAPSYCHSLPLPRSKTAPLKHSKPQSLRTSRAASPPASTASGSRSSVDPEGSQNQRSANLRRPEISKKEEFILKHYTQAEPVLTRGSNENASGSVVPSSRALLNSRSSSYCKLSLYNEPQLGQSHVSVTQNYSREIKDFSDDGNAPSISNMSQETKLTNVLGQPCVTATLRATLSPRPVPRSTVVEDLKKLIVMDDAAGRPPPDPTKSPRGSVSPKRLAFTGPVLHRHPLLKPSHLPVQPHPTVFQPTSGLIESEVWNKDIQFNHGLEPLPDTACDLDWNSLVEAAEDREIQGMVKLLPQSRSMSPRLLNPVNNGPNLHHALSEDTGDYVFIHSPDQISHLEVMLRRLGSDLVKEKQNKVALLEEVLRLRVNNRHLEEESLSANVQLRNICQMFNIHPEGTE